jgi:hypothetical protein
MSMVDQIGLALAKADGARFEDNCVRFRRLAVAALQLLARPTDTVVDAAREVVWSDADLAQTLCMPPSCSRG